MRSASDLWTRGIVTFSLTAVVGVTCACGGGMEETAAPEATEATVPAEDRIAYMPTGEGELPAAVLGEAPAPRGMDLHYLEGDDATRGYLALPEGAGPHAALILVHEWDGLNDRVRQVADAFAAEGYVALAADLYQGRMGHNPEENMALVGETLSAPEMVVANLNAAAAYLRGRPDVSGKVAVMGWCFGGGVALSYGLDGDQHEGTAMFYGRLVQDPERLKNMTHPIYGTFAEQDTGIPPADVEKFVESLRAVGIENDVHIYDEMAHGFWLWVDQDQETRRGPGLDAWQRLKAYLNKMLS